MNQRDVSLPAQADLRYLIDLHNGQSVALLNFGKYLQAALEGEGVHLDLFSEDHPLPTKTYDAIFFAARPASGPTASLAACASALKPGGQLLYCFANKFNPKKMSNVFKTAKHGVHSLSSAQNDARSAGLKTKAAYGILDNITEPRFLVPLENPHITNFFYTHMLVPYTISTNILAAIAPFLVALNFHTILYSDLCLVLEV